MLGDISDISGYLQPYSSYFEMFNLHSKRLNSKVPVGKKMPLVII